MSDCERVSASTGDGSRARLRRRRQGDMLRVRLIADSDSEPSSREIAEDERGLSALVCWRLRPRSESALDMRLSERLDIIELKLMRGNVPDERDCDDAGVFSVFSVDVLTVLVVRSRALMMIFAAS